MMCHTRAPVETPSNRSFHAAEPGPDCMRAAHRMYKIKLQPDKVARVEGKGKRTRPTKHLKLILGAALSRNAYDKTRLQAPILLERDKIQVGAIPDTGSMLYLTGRNLIKLMGIALYGIQKMSERMTAEHMAQHSMT